MYVYAVLFGCVQCRSRLGAHLVVGPTYWDFGALKYLSGPDLPTKFRACLIILTLTIKKKCSQFVGPAHSDGCKSHGSGVIKRAPCFIRPDAPTSHSGPYAQMYTIDHTHGV